MNIKNRPVIFVSSFTGLPMTSQISKVQSIALNKHVPMAVMVFIYYDEEVSRYKNFDNFFLKIEKLEQNLAARNIPLMLFIGDPVERIEACIKHLSPSHIFINSQWKGFKKTVTKLTQNEPQTAVSLVNVSEKNIDNTELIAHPTLWPGPIIGSADLKSRVRSILIGNNK